jgi:transcriptional regulator with XRE-family HTH domain
MIANRETGNRKPGGMMGQLQRGFGEELRRRRMAAGLSLRDLAALVHYTRGHLSKVETGHAWASPELGRLCDAVLNADGALIALTQSVATGGDGAAVIPTLFAPRADLGVLWRGPVGTSEARSAEDAFQDVFARMRALGQLVRPAFLLQPLITQGQTLSDLAVSASGADKARLLGLAARITEYAGWMAQEAGDDRAALALTEQAVELATAAGDEVMNVYAQLRRSLVSLYRNDSETTVSLARDVQADPRAPGRVRGLAALREAQGHALAGASLDCYRALDRARGYLDTVGAEPGQLPLGTSALADPVAMISGWCDYDLGQPLRAAEILSSEISRIPPSASRARARYGTRCALAYAAAGEIDVACQVTGALLAEVRDVGSATIHIEFRRLAKVLNRWPSHPGIRELQPVMNSVLTG